MSHPLYREWPLPGEVTKFLLAARQQEVGSRIGGQIRIPHPATPHAPTIVPINATYPQAYDTTVNGKFYGQSWAEDPAMGWWAEAQTPQQDAVRIADYLAVGLGEIGIAVTDRRISVVFPERLLAEVRAQKMAENSTKGLFGRMVGSVGDWLSNDHWEGLEKVVSLWETDIRRVRGWVEVLAGRGFPFARLLRLDFVDGSTLYGRIRKDEIII